MDFTEPANWAQIRREAEEFVAGHVTREVIENERRTGDGVDRALTRKLGERGWIAAGWPVAEGGAGLDPFEAVELWDALRKGGVPTIGPGTTMLPANAIRATGSPELKARILPGVAAGETLICLGYTEPAGGSDVFACATRSQRDGDEWIVNGQKIFTTFAHMADYCFLLTRSQPGSAGPRGLTMLLVPLDLPGIEIQAVHTVGHERTNIVFYNDVRVADANRVGEAHDGFAVMRAALEAEQNVAPASRTGLVAKDALEFARNHRGADGAQLINDVLVRERLARMAMEAEVADLLGLRAAFLDAEGDKPGPVSALFGPESYVRASAAAIDIAGTAGMLDWTDPQSAVDGSLDAHYRSAVATTI
jgi:alkylation response protein AidB-like acyl-CoA dehydrogenase